MESATGAEPHSERRTLPEPGGQQPDRWSRLSMASPQWPRVFPWPIAIAIIIGGIAGYWALLAPGGIPLGIALVLLGIWIMRTTARRTAS